MNTSEQKNQFRKYCEENQTIPLFCKDWWLDVVSGKDQWEVITIGNGDIIDAVFPYFIQKKNNFRYITMPPLTLHLGPWINYPENQKYEKQLSFEKKILNKIINQLPKYDFFNINLNPQLSYWLPFVWNGFSQSSRVTYQINLEENQENIFSRFSSKMRNKVNKSIEEISVHTSDDIELFYKINSLTFARQGLPMPYKIDFIKKLDNELKSRKKRTIFFAKDKNGVTHSTVYIVWDSRTAFLLMAGDDPEFRYSGAGIRLIWESIKYAKNELELKVYDFAGSMIENVEIVRRSCGGRQTVFQNIKKNNSYLLKFKNCFQNIFSGTQ